MLEKIGTPGFETISRPDPVVLRLLDEILAREPAPVFYEIGVGVGATTLPVARAMANRGQICLFSRQHDVSALAADLAGLGFGNVNSDWGSASHTFSGYHFELARGFAAGALPAFDLAYLDGGHVFHLDAPAALVLKELCKPGGYIVLDDYRWSLARSPTQNPAVRPQTARDYDPAQIETAHVELVCRVVMDTDRRFERLGVERNSCIYRRVPVA
jgi:predicted O-methyltransferase YrrM